MSEDHLEVVRRSIDGLNRGDVEAVLEAFDPDVLFEPQRAAMQGTYRGHAGVREWMADTAESFSAFRLDLDHRDLGEGRVLSVGSLHLRGQGSGVETEVPVASIATVRDGTIVRLKDYGDRPKALEAAGILT
jgi:ketosteroid isomerase-like protein